MLAKVKITVVSSKQEFILLVAKMNLKGILVFTPQRIPINSALKLELKLGKTRPISLNGKVHKITETPSAKKGLLIVFIDPSPEGQKRIEQFIEKNKDTSKKTKPVKKPKKSLKKIMPKRSKKKTAPEEQNILKPEKTVIVDNTLPALSLQSPDNLSAMHVTTKDEENIHHASARLGEATRHLNLSDTVPRHKAHRKSLVSRLYRALGAVLVLVGIVVFFRHGIGWIQKTFNISLVPESSQTITQTPTSNSGTATPSTPVNTPKGKANLDSITSEDQGDYLKITLLGDGDFASFVSEKVKNPHKIILTFNNITNANINTKVDINNPPISKIETAMINNKVQVTLWLSENSFPDFDPKPFPNGMDLFFYRD